MPVNYTNRKGLTYTLYQGQTKMGKPRYYFGRMDQPHNDPLAEMPPGFTISESVNGVVSLVKDLPLPILPEEVEAVEDAVRHHPKARRYRVVVKRNQIEVYEQVGDDYSDVFGMVYRGASPGPTLARKLQDIEDRYARYSPVLRFTLIDPKRRLFDTERMCYLGSIDGWLQIGRTGPAAKLARELIPALGTDDFYDL